MATLIITIEENPETERIFNSLTESEYQEIADTIDKLYLGRVTSMEHKVLSFSTIFRTSGITHRNRDKDGYTNKMG